MSSKEVGIEQARKTLGDLVTAAQQGADIILTRNGKRAARIVAIKEPTMNLTVALINAGIDADRITSNPLGEIRIDDTDGSHVAVSSEPTDDGNDWWTATRYGVDDTQAMIFEGANTDALVRTLAAA